MIISVHHPRLPLGRIWLPIPSLSVYLGAWAVRVWLRFGGRRSAGKGRPAEGRLELRKLARYVTKAAWALLCSGSYVLCDVKVPGEGVRVKVRLV